MKYKFSECCKKIMNGNKVILANRQTGQWIRISKEVYDILDLGINNNLSIDELELNLYDDEDKRYIRELYKKLCYIGIIEDENNKQVLKNKIALFEITHRCNLRCIHCCADADGVISDKKDLTTEESERVLDKLIEWNPEIIMLSGGEPMLRKDFTELLIYLKKHYKGKIVISTNATLINDKNVNILAKCAYQIDISLDGIDEKTCSLVRGPGVFGKVINSVKLLNHAGFEKITLSMVVADKNEQLESSFNKLNKKLGTKPIIRMFAPIGRGMNNKSYFSNLGENKSYLPKSYIKDILNGTINSCSCKGGRQELFISYNGNVYPCPSLMNQNYLLGNVLSIKSISDLSVFKKKNYDLFDILNSEIYRECKNCKVNLFCWTCPGTMERLKYNELAIRDKCKKIRPILYKEVWGMNYK